MSATPQNNTPETRYRAGQIRTKLALAFATAASGAAFLGQLAGPLVNLSSFLPTDPQTAMLTCGAAGGAFGYFFMSVMTPNHMRTAGSDATLKNALFKGGVPGRIAISMMFAALGAFCGHSIAKIEQDLKTLPKIDPDTMVTESLRDRYCGKSRFEGELVIPYQGQRYVLSCK